MEDNNKLDFDELQTVLSYNMAFTLNSTFQDFRSIFKSKQDIDGRTLDFVTSLHLVETLIGMLMKSIKPTSEEFDDFHMNISLKSQFHKKQFVSQSDIPEPGSKFKH